MTGHFIIFVFLSLPALVAGQVGSCASTADCVTNSVCIGTPNGECFCLNPYVTSDDSTSCIYSCQEVLTAPTNGGIDTSEGNTIGVTVYYSCDAGYNLNGDATRQCDITVGGWTGSAPTCVEIDECTSSPCENSGFCQDQVNGYICICPNGFTGTHCETNIDECASDPCTNGATCVDGVNGFTCTCAGGYTDTLCDADIDECASNPCSFGVCTNNLNSYTCTCQPGYTGTNCDTEIDECASDPCDNDGTCFDFVNQFFCNCVPGYDQPTCSIDIDECASNPCENGATCNDFLNQYNCTCVAGYEGVHCETDTDECASDPCENGGTCNDQVNMYTCTCAAGYNGTHCEIDIDECASSPCQNGATCNDQVNMYICTCAPGYNGTHCEIDIDECASSPCQNGATCNDQVNMYTCTCAPGYNGTHCEIDIDECASDPCQNGAICNDQVNQYNCTCAPGYESTHCEIDTDECASDPCQNGATCNDQVNQYNCTCVAGYEGVHCEIDTDECASDPCQNGATCNDQVNGYTCACAPGYESTHCEIDTDECASDPCENGATCNDMVNMYTCTCAPGYTSTHCEIEINECDSNPCQNEATCNDFIDFYNCTCKPGFADFNCDRDIDECVSLPCENGGTCIDFINYFGCECQAGFTDVTCRKSVLYDQCHLSDAICDGILNAACDSSTCVCITGYTDYGNATCNRVDCGPLNSPLNGEVDMNQGTLFEAVATFECDVGYSMVGSATTTCLSTASWSDPEPVCNIKDCGALASPADGSVITPTGTEFGDIATYSCNMGYNLNGVETVTCQADATWTQTPPICDIVDCLVIGAPIQGSVTFNPNTLYQGFADYTCNEGYTLNGNTRRQCQADGTWSLTAPTCMINDCGMLSAPSDGSITLTGTTYLSVATFECDVGYDLSGSASRVCQADTAWNGTITLCVIRDCGAPAAPTNGAVDFSSGTKYQDIATFSCDAGYDLTGVATRECQADGTWQMPFPTCVIKDCGSLTPAANTQIDTSSGTTFGAIAVYSCDPGYEISSATDKRTCTSAGTWTTTIPTCSRRDCGTLLAPSNGNIDLSGGTLFEAVALFSCDTGYTLNGASSTTCQSDATWSDPNPTCDIRDCGVPAAPTNGAVSLPSGTTYLAVATFSCDMGYTLSGDVDRTCQATGSWDSPFPTCQINDCGMLTPLANTQVDTSSGTTYLSVATYTCDTGYELATGTDKRTCQSDSTWTTPEPFCTRRDCGALTSPMNGVVTYSGTLYQDVATYSCNAGYTLNGVTTRTCQDTGVWDGTAPTCNINDCGSLSSPANGDVNTNSGTTYLQLAIYTCDTGYDLVGATTRTCQADGTWSSTMPACQIKDCGSLTAPTNGVVNTDSGTTFGQTATYQCVVGYDLVGVATRTCLSTGLWSDSIPACTIRDCGTPPSLANGQSTVFTTTYLSAANYSCEDNFGLVGTASVLCLSTGNWATLPECVPDCGVPAAIADGTVTYPAGTLEGAVATYTCDGGYTMNGGATVTCGSDGSWSTAPACSVNLEGYNSACFTVLQCQTDRASCLDDGTGTTRCLCNTVGQFYDSTVDSCLTDCGGLSNPTNGIVTLPTQTAEGQIATYTCHAGFALSGNSTRTCQASGAWTGMAPTCLTGCTLPEPPLNGMVDDPQGLLAGSAITYTCNTGYALVGQTARVCLADSTFSGEEPECRRECPELPTIKHGTVDLSLGNWEDSLATYICNRNYALVGQSTRLCESTGSWSGTEPTCIFSVFPNIVLVFGIILLVLVLVDLIVLSVFLYKKFFKKRLQKMKDGGEEDDKKKPAFLPFMVERPGNKPSPPPSYGQSQNKSTKFSNIAPDSGDDHDMRMRKPVLPPPRKPLNPLRKEKPSFFKHKDKKKPEKMEKNFEAGTYGSEKEKSLTSHVTTVNAFMTPDSGKQTLSTAREDKINPQLPEAENKDGYNTGNSDESNQRRAPSVAEEDQLSLNDFDIPKPKPNTPMGETDSKFKARLNMPPGHVILGEAGMSQKPMKPVSEDGQKYFRTTVNAYSSRN